MNVLHVLNHSAPKYTGYTFRTLSLLRAMRELGVNTSHLTSSKQTLAPRDGSDMQEGMLFHRTPPGPLNRLPILGQMDVVRGLANRLDDVIAIERPDLIHAHSPALTGLAALSAGRKHGLPVVYEIRAFWEDAGIDQGKGREGDLRYRAIRALETHVARGADAVVTICDGLRTDLIHRGIDPGKIVVVPNGVDPDRFTASEGQAAAIRSRFGLEGAELLGFFGTFFRYEGLSLLLEAMVKLIPSRPRLRLLLAGDGEKDAEMRKFVAREELVSKVIFAGRVPQSEVGACYRAADLLVYPRLSLRVTELVTPLKPLEAMAAGRPVLASDVGGHRELIRDGITGALFHKDDSAELARRIVELLDDNTHRQSLGEAGREWVMRERRWKVIVERDLGLYDRLLEFKTG